MKSNIKKYLRTTFIFGLVLISTNCSKNENSLDFFSHFPRNTNRTWIGPEYWTNPLQDWQLNNGRIECVVSGGDRNVVLLTREITNGQGEFELSVEFGKLDNQVSSQEEGWIGFKVGVRGEFSDYRDSAVRGEGFPIGITTNGRLFIGEIDSSLSSLNFPFEYGKLQLHGKVTGDKVKLSLKLFDKKGGILSAIEKESIDSDWISGMIAIVAHSGELLEKVKGNRTAFHRDWRLKPGTWRHGNMRFWFNNLQLTGSLAKSYPDRSFGPLLFSQYTLSKGVLKLSVQLPPIGEQDEKEVLLQIKENNNWKTLTQAKIDKLSRTATFRIKNWKYNKDMPYRLSYSLKIDNNEFKDFYREGIISQEPWGKDEIVVAGFTGNNDVGFPNSELSNAVKYHNPDVLFFSGDQIYEGVGGYAVQTDNLEKMTLDYLRKWYLFGWAYGDLMRNRPTITITDDHDVYHGNIWGAGGIATPKGLHGSNAQDAGGYKYSAEWVRVVERTQTSHLPDPYDPAPVEQGIGVYYCNMNYAGISFAIIEDRKFKSAPKTLLPKAKINNGWAQNRKFNAVKNGNVSGAVLLGKRQEEFLDYWSSDWSNKTWMKVLLSQTIFANVATLPKKDAFSDAIVPKLRIMEQGDYPPDDVPVSDFDSNGWPQTPRNRTLKIIRKAFAFHIAGDQHLGSTIQYGVDNWNDAGFAFCVPSISNIWPRRWFPSSDGLNRKEEMPKYSGDFKDGFGNLMTVNAVSNPFFTGKKPSKLYDRATGYGIIKFNRKSRDIKIECWPRWVDPSKEDAKQYPGWPITINQSDNYSRKPVAYLPNLIIRGMNNPVVQILNEDKNEVVYTIRVREMTFQPYVFEKGKYTIRIGELGTKKEKIIKNITASANNDGEIDIVF